MTSRFFTVIMAATVLASSCKSTRPAAGSSSVNGLRANLDLVNVVDDKVQVTVFPPALSGTSVDYTFARIIPGTYAIADYGRYVESVQAFDKNGGQLKVNKKDVNTWTISDPSQLQKLIYLVNDTYDNEKGDAFSEGSTTIFSPAGTNILAGKNFVLNMCGFVGYFEGAKDIPYSLYITHPEALVASTSLSDLDNTASKDLFSVPRYAEMVDHPIMYAAPDIATENIAGMEVILSVYSPRNKAINAKELFPELSRMMKAQKNYLGAINNTKKYAVLTYITSMGADDAKGLGALEHNTSTTATFADNMKKDELIHVISHEFFHTLTPLKVHSREIQDFNFRNPVMSKHLWMYEGFTEYFAQHFQVHEGLVTEEKFFAAMAGKETNSKSMYKDNMSFTEMSKNVLDPKVKSQYPNVYEKGALMAMCLDIILREKTNGKTGLLHVMGELVKKYGDEKPFNDDEIIDEFTRMTYPEVGDFLQRHVVKGEPIPYEVYLAKVGMAKATVPVPTLTAFFAEKRQPVIGIDPKEKLILANSIPNDFYNSLGVKAGDVLLSFNGQVFDASDPTKVLMSGVGVEEGSEGVMKIRRDGKEMELKGKVKLNYEDGLGYKVTDPSKAALKNAWLKQ